MISVHGVLTVKQISGSNGKFCTGDLNCDLGEFKVKETILDQFEEGRYEGEFVIERFYLSSYIWRGKSTTDIRAKVTGIHLDLADEGAVEDAPMEPDPITDSMPVTESVDGMTQSMTINNRDGAAGQKATEVFANDNEGGSTSFMEEEAQTKSTALCKTVDSNPEVAALLAIFGDELSQLILTDMTVKLDPTIDRSLFREQRMILKERGYQFDAMAQTWFKNAGEVQHANE